MIDIDYFLKSKWMNLAIKWVNKVLIAFKADWWKVWFGDRVLSDAGRWRIFSDIDPVPKLKSFFFFFFWVGFGASFGGIASSKVKRWFILIQVDDKTVFNQC